jgi:hypothetical protein
MGLKNELDRVEGMQFDRGPAYRWLKTIN